MILALYVFQGMLIYNALNQSLVSVLFLIATRIFSNSLFGTIIRFYQATKIMVNVLGIGERDIKMDMIL